MDDKSSASPLPPIWVLNLQRSPKRRQFMVNQLKSFDLDFQMVEAVDGWSLSAEELEKYSPEKGHFSLAIPIMQRLPNRLPPAQGNFALASPHHIRDV